MNVEKRKKEERKSKRGERRTAGLAVLLAAAVWMLPAAPVYAVGTEDGSIRIVLEEGCPGTSKEGVVLSCTKTADVKEGVFYLTEAYQESGVDLNRIEYAEEMEYAAQQLALWRNGTDIREEQRFLQKTDENGVAVFSQLPEGVYLIKAEMESKYDKVSPFLVSVPFWDEEQNVMLYNIEAAPKHTSAETSNPKTGEKQTGLIFWTGAGILAVLTALGGRYRGKKQNEE